MIDTIRSGCLNSFRLNDFMFISLKKNHFFQYMEIWWWWWDKIFLTIHVIKEIYRAVNRGIYGIIITILWRMRRGISFFIFIPFLLHQRRLELRENIIDVFLLAFFSIRGHHFASAEFLICTHYELNNINKHWESLCSWI